jgi:hypothetical protein
MWASLARTARRVHQHSRARGALPIAPNCEEISQNMCFPGSLRVGSSRHFCGQSLENFPRLSDRARQSSRNVVILRGMRQRAKN